MRLASICSALLFVFLVGANALCGTYQFVPVADAPVKSTYPDDNFGRKKKLRTDGKPIQLSFLRFQIAGITGSITRVELRIYAVRGNPDGFQVNEVLTDWDESTITFNNQPALAGEIGSSAAVADEAWAEVE